MLAELGTPADLPLLMAALYDPDVEVRQAAEAAIWRVWSGRVISANPDFAEGWNKRATVYFQLGENELSLKDCAEVLKRNPQHFGVLSGYGQLYVRKGDLERALDYFRRALTINPNMNGVRNSIDLIEKLLVERRRRFI